MPTSHDVFVSTLSSYQGMRDAFVELRGYLVTLRTNDKHHISESVDEYGDLVNITTFTDSEIKIVPNFSKYYTSVKTYTNTQTRTNESAVVPLEAICRLEEVLDVGDRIKFTHEIPEGLENKEFQIAKVETQIHFGAISKKITMVPVRDL